MEKLVQLFKKYRVVIQFIISFLGSYLVLAILYHFYLENSSSSTYYPDFFTHLVALQSEAIVSAFGYSAKVLPDANFPTMNLFVDGRFVARIIEGCNSVSIIILFIAFMLSFFGRLKPSLMYIFVGIVVIYTMNIIRIALLSIGIYELPQYAGFLHKIVFPLIIYGTVFVLWIIWIRIYSKQKKS